MRFATNLQKICEILVGPGFVVVPKAFAGPQVFVRALVQCCHCKGRPLVRPKLGAQYEYLPLKPSRTVQAFILVWFICLQNSVYTLQMTIILASGHVFHQYYLPSPVYSSLYKAYSSLFQPISQASFIKGTCVRTVLCYFMLCKNCFVLRNKKANF